MQDKRKTGKQNQGFTDKPATNALQAQTAERIAVEKVLREQDAQFSSLFKAAPVGIGLVIERVFTQVNPHFCEMLGYKEAELIGQSARMIYPNQTEFLRVGELKYNQIEERGIGALETQFITKTKAILQIYLSSTLVDPTDISKGSIFTALDVTAQKKAEESFREREDLYRNLFETSPQGIVTLDLRGFITSCNSAFLKLSQFTKDEVIGKHFTKIQTLYRRDIPSYVKLFASLIKGKTLKGFLFDWQHKDGSLRIGQAHVGLIRKNGKINGIQAIVQDVTQSKNAEQDLKESEEKFRTVVTHSQPVIFMIDSAGTFTLSEGKGLAKLGLEPGQVVEQSAFKMYEGYPAIIVGLKKALKGELHREVVQVGNLHFDTSYSPLKTPAGKVIGVIGMAVDISEQIQARQSLEWESSVNQALAELSHAVIGSSTSPELVAQITLDLAQKLTNSEHGFVSAINAHTEDDGTLQARILAGCWQTPRNDQHIPLTRDPETHFPSFVNQALITRQSIFTNQPSDHDSIRTLPKWHVALKNILSVPAIFNNELVGQVALANCPRDYTDKDLKVVEQLAELYAIALHRQRAEQELESSEKQYRMTINTMNDWLHVVDTNLKVILINQSFLDILATLEISTDVEGKHLLEVFPFLNDGIWEEYARVIETGELLITEEVTLINGREIITEVRKLPLTYEDRVTQIVTIIRDITERKRAEEHLEFLATHDALTEIPNRLLYHDRLEQALARASRNQSKIAVMYLDLDNFKSINDAFGHAVGDQVLKMLAGRIKNALRDYDTVARAGGDEFLILLEEIRHPDDASPIAQKILESISVVFRLEEHEIYLTASLGISIFPESGQQPESLIRYADAAMYQAKLLGDNSFMYFSKEMAVSALERITKISQLRKALERDEFVLHYQPQVDIRTGEILGVEALVRWEHPEAGLLLPREFISLVEAIGLIIPLGNWVMAEACKQTKKWQKAGYPNMRVSINLSERQLKQPTLLDTIRGVLRASKLDPSTLEFEITENCVFQQLMQFLPILVELKEMGVRISIDDFGAGYSTLSQLTQIPFDVLKIDKIFANRVTTDQKDIAIISGLLDISDNLGMEVIGEGIETAEQLAIFQSEGCSIIQGFYFSQPVAGSEIPALLEKGMGHLLIGSGSG